MTKHRACLSQDVGGFVLQLVVLLEAGDAKEAGKSGRRVERELTGTSVQRAGQSTKNDCNTVDLPKWERESERNGAC